MDKPPTPNSLPGHRSAGDVAGIRARARCRAVAGVKYYRGRLAGTMFHAWGAIQARDGFGWAETKTRRRLLRVHAIPQLCFPGPWISQTPVAGCGYVAVVGSCRDIQTERGVETQCWLCQMLGVPLPAVWRYICTPSDIRAQVRHSADAIPVDRGGKCTLSRELQCTSYPLDRNVRVPGPHGPRQRPPPTHLHGDATTIMHEDLKHCKGNIHVISEFPIVPQIIR